MNRREALAALVSMPEIAKISAMPVLRRTDVIVVEVDKPCSAEMASRMREQLREVWPNHKIVVMCDGAKIKVAAGEPTP